MLLIYVGGVWEIITIKGGHSTGYTVAGHSTVYHSDSRSLIVLGGHRANNARFSKHRYVGLGRHRASNARFSKHRYVARLSLEGQEGWSALKNLGNAPRTQVNKK